MTRIQGIKRPDGTQVYTLYVPVQCMIDSGLNKGDDVEITTISPGELKVKKK